MAQAFENFEKESLPKLRKILQGKTCPIVNPGVSIRETGVKMAETRKAALAVENGRLMGIFGFKDMMTGAVARGRDLDNETVASVMTEDPEFVSPNTNVLEAMQIMHDSGFLNLPVCEDDGAVVGLVGIMDLINGCRGADGWRLKFSSTMELGDDASEVGSVVSRDSRNSRSRYRECFVPVCQ